MELQAKARLLAANDETIEEEVRGHRNFKAIVSLAEKLLTAQHNVKTKMMGFDPHQRKVLAHILKEEVGVDVSAL